MRFPRARTKWEAWNASAFWPRDGIRRAFTAAAALASNAFGFMYLDKDWEKLGYPQTADFDTDKAVRAGVEAMKLLIAKISE
jgi:hypothetical protein